MSRYRPTFNRSEEQKRNLKVDLRRIPEWQAELDSIRNGFSRFHEIDTRANLELINETIAALHLGGQSWDIENERRKFESWKMGMSLDSLVQISGDYSAPEFLRAGVTANVVEEILTGYKKSLVVLKEAYTKGITSSFWVSLFSRKIHVDQLSVYVREKQKYATLSEKLPRIKLALTQLRELHSESSKHVARYRFLVERLSLAVEKKAAIERFELKHGNAFAKAAAVDKKTRSRATSLKRLVEKTESCPYCGGVLGSDPHLDHIYPVSKGGSSTIENLVWCCSSCNALKLDQGLIKFLGRQGFSVEKTLARLLELKKHV